MKKHLLLASGAVCAFVLVAVIAILPAGAASAARTDPRIVSVDYVLALMDAQIDQKEIVRRIEERNLSFRIAAGDIDRLRAAGADDALIEVVTGEGVTLENREPGTAPGAAGAREGSGADTQQWRRPQRIGTEGSDNQEGDDSEDVAPPAATYQREDDGQGIEEIPQGDYGYSYGYYAPGYYDYAYSYGYPYPYYYSPYYSYPYGSYIYYSHPYYRHHYSYGYRTTPRGSGTFHGSPRGGGMSPRMHGGGGGGGGRPPRGSHH